MIIILNLIPGISLNTNKNNGKKTMNLDLSKEGSMKVF